MNSDMASWIGRLRAFYAGLEPRRRRNWLLVTGFFLLTVILLSALLLNPRYVPVFTNLDPKSAGQITQQLDQSKIPYQLQGTTILVPAAQADKVRIDMAMAGLPSSGYVEYSQIFQSGNTFGLSDQELQLQEQSILQERLAQTLESINGIENAVVNVVPAQSNTFLDPSVDLNAKASVLLTVAAGAALTPSQVAGIQELVAHAVPGLSVQNVSVVDQYGDNLSSITTSAPVGASLSGGSISEELALRQSVEQSLAHELQDSLQQWVGQGNVSVLVHAAIAFNAVSRQTHTVTQGPPVSTQSSSSSSTGASSGSGGVAGQPSQNPNAPTYGSTGGGSGGNSAQRSSLTNYDNSFVNTSTTLDPMQVTGYSVSVLVNTAAVKLTPSLNRAITQYVQTAVGQKATANANNVTVVGTPFVNRVTGAPQTYAPFSSPLAYAGVAALLLVGGGIALALMRRRRKGIVAADAIESLSAASLASPAPEPAELTIARKLQELAQRRPESFAMLLRTWLTDE